MNPLPSPRLEVEFRPPEYTNPPLNERPPVKPVTLDTEYAIGNNVVGILMTQAYQSAASIAAYEQKDKEHWKEQALIDPLTNVGSRRAFELYMADHSEPAMILTIDGDNIGETNKKIGQEAGDYTIMTLANVIKSVVRSTDKIFRIGGDEFVVILCEQEAKTTDVLQAGEQDLSIWHPHFIQQRLDQTQTKDMPNHVRSVADIMLQRILDESLFAGLREMEIGLSVGSATFEEGMSTQQLFDKADIDMRMRKLAKLPNVTPKMIEIHQKYLEDMAAEGISPHILTKMAKAGLFSRVA